VRGDGAASTPGAIVVVLARTAVRAWRGTGLQRLVVAGGVGANHRLREVLDRECGKRKVRVHYPELHLCSDNGAMIALAGALRLHHGVQAATREYAFDVLPRWDLHSVGLQKR
ncbi:MAG: tRNA (adenosine(37)-N6)-threonylcarbamoyltransferase complex transferase subunit TsaD, partial [Rhodoferax sp.]